MSRKTITLPLIVGEPTEIEEGIYETRLTHPKLVGSLSFVHNFAGRDDVLKSLDENLVAGILDVADLVGGLINAKRRNTPFVSGEPSQSPSAEQSARAPTIDARAPEV